MTKRKYKVVLAYDGTGYSGWQYQENAVGIQQVVEDVLAYLEGCPVRIFGSSRTDAGVHAVGFVGHFHLTKPIPPKNLVRAMNSRLPEAIRVLRASYAAEAFDARLSATGKEYRYQLYQADILPPHLAPYWTFCHRPLDLEAMRTAARHFVGEHDFLSFAANPNRELETTVRRIFSFDVKKSGHRYTFIVRGDGFLYKQVRSIRVLRASYAAEAFDARLSATGKEYRYQLYQADILPPHLAPYWTFCHRPLDLEAMRTAARHFVGEHDFLSFAANPNRELETTVRRIFSFDVKKSGHRYTFIVRGDGFLYKQVRSMVGFLISVGKGNERPDAVKELLDAHPPRTARVETAPARGLFLWKVFYSTRSVSSHGSLRVAAVPPNAPTPRVRALVARDARR